jgi:hypothetical protein
MDRRIRIPMVSTMANRHWNATLHGLIPILLCVAAISCAEAPPAGRAEVLVGQESQLLYRVNREAPGLDLSWTRGDFDDGGWADGVFAIGLETDTAIGARALIRTEVDARAASVYCRARFAIDDPYSIESLYLGVDYDDGFVAWINGVEVARSESMPEGPPRWNSEPASHESSNGALPRFDPRHDISESGIPALQAGENILALGVWNNEAASSDLVLAAELRANQPSKTFVTRGPYLQLGTETAVTVRWRTDWPTDSRITYGREPGALRRSVHHPRITTDHRLRITGLKPDSTVFYAVGSSTAVLAGDDEEHMFRTAPPRGTRRPLRVWVLGDSGTAGGIPGWVGEAYEGYVGEDRTDLWIMLGDNAYDYGTDERYQAALFDTFPRMLRRAVLWATPGNHDDRATHEHVPGVYYDVFELPTDGEAGGVASGTEQYYAFDFGNVHFVSLNSEHVDFSEHSPMLRWLERDLKATAADWIVAFWHRTPFSTGLHDSDTEEPTIFMRRYVLPILDRYGVDLVLAGHSHICQRSGLLQGHYGPKSSFAPGMVLDGTGGRTEEVGPYRKSLPRRSGDGIVYVTVGCSGESTVKDRPPPEILVSFRVPGSLVLEVDRLRLDARYVGMEGVVRDYFAIVKDPTD